MIEMKRFLSLACTLLLCLCFLPTAVRADVGPKPQLTIYVEHPPEEPYYLDLLIPEGEGGSYDNLSGGIYDPAILSHLHDWEGEGWYPAFAGGTKAPLFGDIIPEEGNVFRFTYFGLPETFRIAAATAEGGQATAEAFTRTAFYTNLTYDFASNTLSRATPGWLAWLIQFLSTLVPTLLVEGLLLLLFGFSLRKNWVSFLLVNLVTQAALHLVVGAGFVTLASSFAFYLVIMVPAEAVIFVLEALAYSALLKGGSRRRKVLYALAANAASMALGFLALQPVIPVLRAL